MPGSLEKRNARCVKTNAPIRCKECVTKNTEIERLQQVCAIQSLQIVRLQREIALLGLQRSPSRDMVDASVGTDIVLFDSDKPKTCDSNTQSPTMLLTRTDVCCGTDDDLLFTNAQSKCCGTDDAGMIVHKNGLDLLLYPFYEYSQGIFSQLDLSLLESNTVFSHKFQSRSVAHYGDHGYCYSGADHPAKPTSDNPYLQKVIIPAVKKQYPNFNFNSIMVTKYANGSQSIPFHSDNELSILPDSSILTISLGSTRNIVFRSKTSVTSDLTQRLNHGDVMLMTRASQDFYEHAIPKDFSKNIRISITMRNLFVETGMVDGQNTPVLHNRTNSPNISNTFTLSTLISMGRGENVEDVNLYDNEMDIDTEHPSQAPPTPAAATQRSCNNSSEIKSKTLYISSSMFSHLDEKRLCSKTQDAHVFSYPGATASDMHNRFRTDNRVKEIDPMTIQKIFLLCGTNDVDNILNSPRNMRNKLIDHSNRDSMEALTDTFNCIDRFTTYLHEWAPNATIRLLKVLPRESRARNEIITKINSFTSGLIDKLGYVKSCEIEKDRFLFADQHGYRKSQFFSNKGSDNVHLNQNGVVRLANHLKYTAHNG